MSLYLGAIAPTEASARRKIGFVQTIECNLAGSWSVAPPEAIMRPPSPARALQALPPPAANRARCSALSCLPIMLARGLCSQRIARADHSG
jgi:hypothetical protein